MRERAARRGCCRRGAGRSSGRRAASPILKPLFRRVGSIGLCDDKQMHQVSTTNPFSAAYRVNRKGQILKKAPRYKQAPPLGSKPDMPAPSIMGRHDEEIRQRRRAQREKIKRAKTAMSNAPGGAPSPKAKVELIDEDLDLDYNGVPGPGHYAVPRDTIRQGVGRSLAFRFRRPDEIYAQNASPGPIYQLPGTLDTTHGRSILGAKKREAVSQGMRDSPGPIYQLPSTLNRSGRSFSTADLKSLERKKFASASPGTFSF